MGKMGSYQTWSPNLRRQESLQVGPVYNVPDSILHIHSLDTAEFWDDKERANIQIRKQQEPQTWHAAQNCEESSFTIECGLPST